MAPSLCATCRWVREVVTPRGSRFLLCRRAQADPCYPKYPPQPVVRCAGHEQRDGEPESLPESPRPDPI